MSILSPLRRNGDTPKPAVDKSVTEVPKRVQDRLTRGRKQKDRDRELRRLCLKFWRGKQFWYISKKGVLMEQNTVLFDKGGKPDHRIRNSYNFIEPLVAGKVSAATQRVPSYEITPTTSDPEDVGAARLSERVALYGYDKWSVRRATVEAVEYALVTGEGFIFPYFDPNVGPYREDPETGEMHGQGEVRLWVGYGNEVAWEPGVKFDDSRWYMIERARPVDDLEEIPGYYGHKVSADATTADTPKDDADTQNMALTTEYLERPSPKFPQGRRMLIVNGRQHCPEEPYTVRDTDGQVVDEPPGFRISWTVDPEADRDRGLVEQLIDPARTVNDCWNKLLEWKNRALLPRMMAPKGSRITRRGLGDEPGGIDEYDLVGTAKPEWEKVPAVPRELFDMLDLAKQVMREIAADADVQADPDVAARTVQAVIEQSRARWQSFLGDLAETHSRVMRSCLSLVAQFYGEERTLTITGHDNAAPIANFTGAKLRSQIDVRVGTGSIEPYTRQQIEQRAVLFFQQGWITGEAAMAMINGGTGASLNRAYELALSRVDQVIQKIRDGSIMDEPMRMEVMPVPFTDPVTGMTGVRYEPMEFAPWMPREFDQPQIWEQRLGEFLQSPDFDRLEPGMQEVGLQMWRGLQWLKTQQGMQAQQAQQQMAAQLGMENASIPKERQLPDRAKAPGPGPAMPQLPAG